MDFWDGQQLRPELWTEKDALLSIVVPVCEALDVPYYSLRGWSRPTDKMEAARRFSEYAVQGQHSVILHVGDYDPTGLSATENLETELQKYMRELKKHMPDFAGSGDQWSSVRRWWCERACGVSKREAPVCCCSSSGPSQQESFRSMTNPSLRRRATQHTDERNFPRVQSRRTQLSLARPPGCRG